MRGVACVGCGLRRGLGGTSGQEIGKGREISEIEFVLLRGRGLLYSGARELGWMIGKVTLKGKGGWLWSGHPRWGGVMILQGSE